MECIENNIHETNGLSKERHKNFPIHYGLWEDGFLKNNLTYLYCTRYNEINMCNSDATLFSSC